MMFSLEAVSVPYFCFDGMFPQVGHGKFIAGGSEEAMVARLGTTMEACECLLRAETESSEHEISDFCSLL